MRYLRRLIWFIASRLFLAVLILGLMVIAFYYAMNLTNVQIVLKDGMARRAQVVMQIEDNVSELNKYFQTTFLERDAALATVTQGTSPYRDYNIRGIDHRVNIDFAWVWPWDTVCRVEIVESIPRIDGRVRADRAESLIAANGQNAIYPPSWQSAKYRATLTREDGQWKIRALALIE